MWLGQPLAEEAKYVEPLEFWCANRSNPLADLARAVFWAPASSTGFRWVYEAILGGHGCSRQALRQRIIVHSDDGWRKPFSLLGGDASPASSDEEEDSECPLLYLLFSRMLSSTGCLSPLMSLSVFLQLLIPRSCRF